MEANSIRIGIIGAMAIEIERILSEMEHLQTERISSLDFHTGTLNGYPCVVSQCNPGKVNAAVCAQSMILRYAPALIVNTGVAGGTGPDIHIGDIVIGTNCIQHDYDTSPLGDEAGVISGLQMKAIPCDVPISELLLRTCAVLFGDSGTHLGTIATGDCFVSSGAQSRRIMEQFGASAIEMEGGSIAHVCYLNQTPCAVIRGISDNADDDGKVDFLDFAEKSAQKTQLLLKTAIADIACLLSENRCR